MTSIDAFPPGLVLILGAFLLPFLRGTLRNAWILLLPVFVLWLVWRVPDGPVLTFAFLDYTLTPVKGDVLSRLFAIIFAIMAFAGALFAMNQSRVVELTAAFVYAGSAIGVAFAGDLISLFVFWEIMALGSTTVLLSAGGPRSTPAAMRYLIMHVMGGSLLLVGIVVQINATGSIDFVAMKPDTQATWMILLGFLINAAAPLLSAWLPDAYPDASPGGMVFLSAFTTKAAV